MTRHRHDPVKRLGEFERIERYFAPLAGEGAFGLKDDAALITPRPGYDLVINQDALFQGVHFFPDTPMDLIAKRAIRSNISDIIAKGATPLSYSLALGVPGWMTDEDFENLARGLAEDQKKYNIALSGGDTYKTDRKLALSVSMIGEVPSGQYVSRLGASPSESIVVSGHIGDAHLGLAIQLMDMKIKDRPFAATLVERQALPDPPFGLQEIVRRFATASMDVSDGLVGDARKLCSASGISAQLIDQDIAISPEAQLFLQERGDLRDAMLTGGDDYQVLFTVKPQDFEPARKAAQAIGIEIHKIGETGSGPAGEVVVLRDGMRVSFEIESYQHD